MFEIYVSERITTALPKTSSPCVKEDKSNYMKCSKNFIWSFLKNTANCTLPGKNLRSLLYLMRLLTEILYIKMSNFIL